MLTCIVEMEPEVITPVICVPGKANCKSVLNNNYNNNNHHHHNNNNNNNNNNFFFFIIYKFKTFIDSHSENTMER